MFQDLESTGKDTSGKATNDSQHLEQREQQTADVQDTEAASSDNFENSSTVTTSTPKISANLQNCKKGQKRSLNTCVSGVHDAIKKLKEISEENKQDLNEFDVFCESLAIQLKKMPLDRALICQEKLQNVNVSSNYHTLSLTHQCRPAHLIINSRWQLIIPTSTLRCHHQATVSIHSNHTSITTNLPEEMNAAKKLNIVSVMFCPRPFLQPE